MAVHSDNEINDSDDSPSHLVPVRRKLEPSSDTEQVFLISPNLRWYPIHRKKPDTSDNFRSDFFNFLKYYMISHRDFILPENTDDLLLEKVVVKFDIQVLWAGMDLVLSISHLMCHRVHNHHKFLLVYVNFNVLLPEKDLR
jgi:hypothetical protein